LAGDLQPPRCPSCRGRRFDDFGTLNKPGRLTWPAWKPQLAVAVLVTAIGALLIVVINVIK
jgi:hypothetical protein